MPLWFVVIPTRLERQTGYSEPLFLPIRGEMGGTFEPGIHLCNESGQDGKALLD